MPEVESHLPIPASAQASLSAEARQFVSEYRFTLVFAVASVVVIVIGVFLANYMIEDRAKNNSIMSSEDKSVAAASHLQLLISQSRDQRPFILNSLTAHQEFSVTLATLSRQPDVLQVDLVNLDGSSVWSTNPGVIGLTQEGNPFYRDAAEGTISSALVRGHDFARRGGASDDAQVVVTYLPLRETPSGPVIGVMVFYRDIGGSITRQIDAARSWVLWTAILTLGGLFLIISLVANAAITRSYKREISLVQSQLAEREEVNREVERASQAKTQILSTATHELKTPLTSIINQVYLMLRQQDRVGPLNSSQKDRLETILRNSDRLKALIDDLLDISRIESGNLVLTLTEVDVKRDVEEVLSSMEGYISQKQIYLVLDVPTALSPVKADQLRFGQVMTNLLSNACKYSPEGATVTITARERTGLVQIDVSDTGIGMSSEGRSRLFTKFFRVDNSLTRKVSGTGLGLYITKYLVEAHGGKIWAESEENIGSTFSFTLPQAHTSSVQSEGRKQTSAVQRSEIMGELGTW